MVRERPKIDEVVEVSFKEGFLIANQNKIIPLNEVLYPESYKHDMSDNCRRKILFDFLDGSRDLIEGLIEDGTSVDELKPFLDYQRAIRELAPTGLLSLVLGRVVEQESELMLETVSPGRGEYGFKVVYPVNMDFLKGIARYVKQSQHTSISPRLFRENSVVGLNFHPDSVATRHRDFEFVIRSYEDAINPFGNLNGARKYKRETHVAIFNAFLRADPKTIYPPEAQNIAGNDQQLVWKMGAARPKGYSDCCIGRVLGADEEGVVLSNISLDKKENQRLPYMVELSAIKEATLYKTA